ncbi:MAG: hypothetical protein H6828_08995 [Planctomycetes bacterium]|nr:hypothetical protein [Planctomycetota bacterium]
MAYALESRDDAPRVLGLPEPWFHLLAGLALAPVFGLTPLLRLIGWFLGSLVHEMGHAGAAWLVGVPAVPALGMTAEAATMHGEQMLPLALGVWAAAGWAAWRVEHVALRGAWIGLLCVVYPALAFTSLREVVHLVSGHAFELMLGGLFLGRALSGGFSHAPGERTLYAVVGWYLIGRNLALTVGLFASDAARAEYASNGSFGIENDYLRLASETGWSLESLALLMSAAAVAVAPAVVGLWCWGQRRA